MLDSSSSPFSPENPRASFVTFHLPDRDLLVGLLPLHQLDIQHLIRHSLNWNLSEGNSLEARWTLPLEDTLSVAEGYLAAARSASAQTGKVKRQPILSRDELLRVDEALTREYRETYDARPLPREVQRLRDEVFRHPQGGRLVQEVWERTWQRMLRAEDMDEAVRVRHTARLALILKTDSGDLGWLALSGGELLMDVLLLLRGALEDVNYAERHRKPGQTRAEEMLLRESLQVDGPLYFEMALKAILDPALLVGSLSDTHLSVLCRVLVKRCRMEAECESQWLEYLIPRLCSPEAQLLWKSCYEDAGLYLWEEEEWEHLKHEFEDMPRLFEPGLLALVKDASRLSVILQAPV